MTTASRRTEGREVHPPADAYEMEGGVHLSVEMPGAETSSISVTVDDDILTIRAEKEDHLADLKVLHREGRGGDYVRQFRLSRDLAREGIQADYKLGLLHVFIPQAEHTIPRKIEVQVED